MTARTQRGTAALIGLSAGSLILVVSAVASLPGRPGVARAQEAEEAGKYVGASECAKCHEKGMDGRPADHWPQLKESAAWANDDQHAFAYLRLDDEDAPKPEWRSKVTSEDIFDALEDTEADMASESVRCLSCHGVMVHDFGKPKWLEEGASRVVYANEDLQQGYDTSEGVSCDGCHGPASGWLKAHEAKDWALEQWLQRGGAKDPAAASMKMWEELGLYYSKDLVLWAEQCVRCHLQIEQSLIDAEHPDLVAFELWDQNSRVPPHWRDYAAAEDRPELPGAGPAHPAKVWAVGQAVALKAALQQVVQRAAADEVSEEHLQKGAARASSHYTVLRHALPVVPAAADAVEPLATAMTALAEATGDEVDAGAAAEAAKSALKALEPLPYALAGAKLDQACVQQVIAAIEADEQAKQAGQHAEIKALSLVALKKVK